MNRYINWQRQSSTWKKGVCQQLATHRSALVPSREPRHGDCELFLKHVSEVTRWDSKTVAEHCPSAPPAEPGGGKRVRLRHEFVNRSPVGLDITEELVCLVLRGGVKLMTWTG